MSASRVAFRLEPCNSVDEALVDANKFAILRKSRGGPFRLIGFGIRFAARQKPELFYPIVGGLAFAIFKGYIRWYTLPIILIIVAAIIILFLVLRRFPLVKRDLSHAVSVKTLDCYKSSDLGQRAWSQPVARLYNPVIPQPVEGYCGQATLLNVIHSIPSHSYVPRLPPQARPLTLTEMKVICDQLPTFDAKLGVIKVEAIDHMTLSQFQSHMVQLNNPRVRYLANFLRAPLFFNSPDPTQRVNIFKRMFGGHWSPLGAYISDSNGDSDTSYVQVLDVNDSYGTYCVPVNRLFDAINTYDLSNGKSRGLIRIELAA